MELPPVIQIAFSEKLWRYKSVRELKDSITSSGIDQEFATQATWSVEEFAYVDEYPNRAGLGVTPTGSLDPFSTVGKCIGEKCLAGTVDDFIKSVGLYSECAIVPDPLTRHFLDGGRLSDHAYFDLFRDIQILEKVAPLIEANILLLGNPQHGFCAECNTKKQEALTKATDTILSSSYRRHIEIVSTAQGPKLGIQLPELQPDHGHAITTYVPISITEAAVLKRINKSGRASSDLGQRTLHKIISRVIRSDLESLFFELETSKRVGSLLLAGSRKETLVLATLDEHAPSLRDIENWEKLRTVHLPWIDFLTPQETIMLRDKAGKALPRLRELLSTRLARATDITEQSLSQVVDELRAQTLEVQSELDALGLPKERNYRAGMVGLSMAFVIYGLAATSAPVVATSVAALLATFAHLRNAERDHDSRLAKIVSTPGYALLKAKEIISRR